MNWPAICAVIIPCYNEEATVGELVSEVRQYLPCVIVVSDGSFDQTATHAAAAGAQLLRLERNLGKGAALKAGVALASNQGCSWIVTMDGDGQHRPEDIPSFLRCAEDTRAALIVGNRMHRAKTIPWLRRTVNRWMSRRISKRAGASLPDSQCGFRLVNLGAWRTLSLMTNHFEIESEMLLSFVRAGYRIEFVPIQVVPRGSHSHIHVLRDTARWLKWWQGSRRG